MKTADPLAPLTAGPTRGGEPRFFHLPRCRSSSNPPDFFSPPCKPVVENTHEREGPVSRAARGGRNWVHCRCSCHALHRPSSCSRRPSASSSPTWRSCTHHAGEPAWCSTAWACPSPPTHAPVTHPPTTSRVASHGPMLYDPQRDRAGSQSFGQTCNRPVPTPNPQPHKRMRMDGFMSPIPNA